MRRPAHPTDLRTRRRPRTRKARRTLPRTCRKTALSSPRRPIRRRMRVLRRVQTPQRRRCLQAPPKATRRNPRLPRELVDRSRRLPKGAASPRLDGAPFPARKAARRSAASLCDARHRNEIGGDPPLLLKFSCSRSRVAQWQSIRLLIERLLVRVQPRELEGRGEAIRFRPCFA